LPPGSWLAAVTAADFQSGKCYVRFKEHDMTKVLTVLAGLLLLGVQSVLAQEQPMSFFLTSAGPGNGADLGGLAGADQQCQVLAESAGAGDLMWRAYLSAIESDAGPAVQLQKRGRR
jgi:hypothetical protein